MLEVNVQSVAIEPFDQATATFQRQPGAQLLATAHTRDCAAQGVRACRSRARVKQESDLAIGQPKPGGAGRPRGLEPARRSSPNGSRPFHHSVLDCADPRQAAIHCEDGKNKRAIGDRHHCGHAQPAPGGSRDQNADSCTTESPRFYRDTPVEAWQGRL